MKKKVLLVDDDINHLKSMEIFFKYEDYQVLSATNYHQSIELAIKYLPDIIISDLNLGNCQFNGIDILKLIKKDKITKHIPFIILTGNSSIESEKSAIELGVSEYITKPVNLDKLIQSVKALLI